MDPPPWLPTGLVLEECEAKALAQSRQHCVAERKRRERINGHMAALRKLLPGTAQSDKASLLGEVVRTLRELEGEAAQLTEQGVLMPSDVDELDVQEVHPGEEGSGDGPEEDEASRKRRRVSEGAEASSEGGAAGEAEGTERPGIQERGIELESRQKEEAAETSGSEEADAGGEKVKASEEGATHGGRSSEAAGAGGQGIQRSEDVKPKIPIAGAIAQRNLIRVRVSADDKLELLPSFKKTIQLLKLELVNLKTASCWNRVTHELLLARTEGAGASSGSSLQKKKETGKEDEEAPHDAAGQREATGGVNEAGKKSTDLSPALEVIHAAFKASIDRVKARASSAAS